MEDMERVVLHIDMDAFFASVEERDKPRLKGRPIVVGSDPEGGKGRGVVSTANYAARAYGIKSAMPISRAWEKSQQAKREGKPEVVFMEPDMKRYAAVSKEIFTYIASRGDVFQSGGIDEGYLELRIADNKLQTVDERWEHAREVAVKIREWVKKEQGLTCSIGIGPNKLIAKMAAGRQKPDGLTSIKPNDVQEFLDPLSVRELMGVGPKTEQALNKVGIKTIKELRRRSKEFLIEHFGKHGAELYHQSRGIDESPLVTEREAKSISEQMTFDKDTLDPSIVLKAFNEMAKGVSRQVKREGVFFKTIAIIVRFADFETKTRSHTLKSSTNNARVLETEALQLLMPFFDKRENPKKKKLRLVGVRVEKFETKLF